MYVRTGAGADHVAVGFERHVHDTGTTDGSDTEIAGHLTQVHIAARGNRIDAAGVAGVDAQHLRCRADSRIGIERDGRTADLRRFRSLRDRTLRRGNRRVAGAVIDRPGQHHIANGVDRHITLIVANVGDLDRIASIDASGIDLLRLGFNGEFLVVGRIHAQRPPVAALPAPPFVEILVRDQFFVIMNRGRVGVG